LWRHSRSQEEQAQLKEVKSNKNKKYFRSINILSRRWNQVYILFRIRAYKIYSQKSIPTLNHLGGLEGLFSLSLE
jgi:hypothetical protein